jgi:hypothetical protein
MTNVILRERSDRRISNTESLRSFAALGMTNGNVFCDHSLFLRVDHQLETLPVDVDDADVRILPEISPEP